MDQHSSQPDYLLMAMLSYSTGATNIGTLNSEDCLDPRELCNSLYAPTAHEDASWPFPNGGVLEDVPTRSKVLELDMDSNFNSESLENDLEISSVMQLPSNTLPMPCHEEYPSFGPSPIQPLEINVKKGDSRCPHCSTQFKGGAAAVRKHIKQVHIKKGQVEGEVVRSTPGRAKTKTTHEDTMRLATKRRRVDGDDARGYLPLAIHRQSQESTQVTIQEFRNTQKELVTLRQQFADLQVFAMRLQAGMNNQSHDILARFDDGFEKHLLAGLKKLRMLSLLPCKKGARSDWDDRCLDQMSLVNGIIRTRYPEEIGNCKLEYENGTFELSIHFKNITLKYKSEHEEEKEFWEEPFVYILIDAEFCTSSWGIRRITDSGRSQSWDQYEYEVRKGRKIHHSKRTFFFQLKRCLV